MPWLNAEVPEIVLDAALDSGELGAPAPRLPDLEVIRVPDDDGFVSESRVLAEVRRDDDPALAVRVRFMGARQDEMAETRYGWVRARALGDLRVEVGPLIGREDGEAFAYPPCHDGSFFEAASELGRDSEPTLLVQRVGEFACEIAFQDPFRTRRTVPHRPPLLTTRTASYTPASHCQGASRKSIGIGSRTRSRFRPRRVLGFGQCGFRSSDGTAGGPSITSSGREERRNRSKHRRRSRAN